MVARCRAAGVDIYADAVINHMAPGSGAGSNGTPFTRYNYAPLYGPADFHPACSAQRLPETRRTCRTANCWGFPTWIPVSPARAAEDRRLPRRRWRGWAWPASASMPPSTSSPWNSTASSARVNRTLVAEGRRVPYFFLEVIDPGTEAVKRCRLLRARLRDGWLGRHHRVPVPRRREQVQRDQRRAGVAS